MPILGDVDSPHVRRSVGARLEAVQQPFEVALEVGRVVRRSLGVDPDGSAFVGPAVRFA